MKLKLVHSFLLIIIFSNSYASQPIRFDGKSQLISFNQTEQPSIDQLMNVLKESGLPENYSSLL